MWIPFSKSMLEYDNSQTNTNVAACPSRSPDVRLAIELLMKTESTDSISLDK